MVRIWPKTAKIYWDPWRNIPVVRPRQEELDLYYAVRLSEPGDARPVFPGDLEKLKDAILYEYGSDKVYMRLFNTGFMLFNKVPHWDLMYEIVSSGNVLGQLYYDPFREKWRFRLTYSGAYIASEEGLVDKAVLEGPIYTGREVKPAPSTSMRQLIIVDKTGNIRGLGEVYGDSLIIVKTFHDRTMPVETSGKSASIEDVLKHNEEGLEALAGKSISYLKRLRGKYRLPVSVSYSGGKDSLVALDLAYKAFGELEMVFNDTGLELPETIKNVHEVSEKYGVRLHIASAGDIFWRAVTVFGPPGKDYRWCCKVAKLVPIARLTRTLWPNGALNIVGQRAFESLDRAKSPRVWRNKWIPHLVSTSPIQEWSQLECWLYIFKHKLPYNKLYERGFDRLGCFLCPSSALAEFKDVEKEYPELWGKWERILEEWRVKLGQPAEWVKLGLWRWLTPASAKRRIARHIENYSIDWRREYTNRLLGSSINLAPLEIVESDNELKILFNKEVLAPSIREVVKVNMGRLGYSVEEQEDVFRVSSVNTVITVSERSIHVKPFMNSENTEDLVDLLKVIYRAYGCVKCGSCILWIPPGNAMLTQNGPIPLKNLDDKTRRFYLEACPISDQLVEKTLVPLILGTPKAFKRKTRRRIITSEHYG
ncbi:MAG: phosphoadenosine phosphosulfate reductase family protein [Desulfurococcus sp.]|uniref:phosphoadenosine phosphosulfate reductase domain-containing protein n=2 Tax=Desulfurococcus sp. TaxID=51678 RepID=UPI003162117A